MSRQIVAGQDAAMNSESALVIPLDGHIKPASNWLKLVISFILLSYVALAFWHSRIAPVDQTGLQNAPDEAAHLKFAQTVARGILPTLASASADPQGYEWHQPPLYYCLVAPVSGDPFTARIPSIMIGCLALAILYLVIREIFPDREELIILSVGFAAFLPTHLAITSTVNNDVLLELLSSSALLVLLKSLRSGASLQRGIGLGVIIGLALLTKLSALLLVIVAFVAIIMMMKRKETRTFLVPYTVASASSVLLICSWWFFRNHQLYGQFVPTQAFSKAFAGTVQAAPMIEAMGLSGYYQLLVSWTFQSFWAVYGTLKDASIGRPRFLEPSIYQLCFLNTILAVLGLIKGHLKDRRTFSQFERDGIALLMLHLVIVLVSFALFTAKYFQAQGRYLFPSLSAISLLFALGWMSLISSKYARVTAGFLISIQLLLAVLLLRHIQFST